MVDRLYFCYIGSGMSSNGIGQRVNRDSEGGLRKSNASIFARKLDNYLGDATQSEHMQDTYIGIPISIPGSTEDVGNTTAKRFIHICEGMITVYLHTLSPCTGLNEIGGGSRGSIALERMFDHHKAARPRFGVPWSGVNVVSPSLPVHAMSTQLLGDFLPSLFPASPHLLEQTFLHEQLHPTRERAHWTVFAGLCMQRSSLSHGNLWLLMDRCAGGLSRIALLQHQSTKRGRRRHLSPAQKAFCVLCVLK